MPTTAITLSSLFNNPVPSHGDAAERRHDRLAITWIGVAIVVMIVATGLELWTINHVVASLMDGFTKHLMPTQYHATTTR